MTVHAFFACLLQLNIWDMAQHSGPLAMAVLAILVCFSIFSWTVIFAKWQALRGGAARPIRVSCGLSASPAASKR